MPSGSTLMPINRERMSEVENKRLDLASSYYGFTRSKFIRLAIAFAIVNPRPFQNFLKRSGLEDNERLPKNSNPYEQLEKRKDQHD